MQYKRKAEYLPAVLVFVACVSLVSVGFSSWNYWENVSDEATIDVTVSSVEDLTGVSITNNTTDIAIGTYFYQDIKNKKHSETANIDYLIKPLENFHLRLKKELLEHTLSRFLLNSVCYLERQS